MIAEIELLLKEIEGLGGKELKNKRNEYVRKLVQMCELSNSNYSSQVLFDPTNSPQKKRFISACLLRLICHNENAVWEDHDFRVKTFILFDEQIADVYSILKIETSKDNHVKLSLLKDLEKNTLEKFNLIASGISSFKTAIDLQSKLMKILTDPLSKIFLDTFVDNRLTLKERIRELFNCLRDYNQAYGVSRMEVYQEVDNVFSAYIKDAEDSCSVFAKVYNIRSLSQEGSQIGFILVGGENMQIIRQSTDRLNLFSPFQVDYFDKEKFFGDFQELIRYPLQNILEFSDESINEIYELTEGNPFFTKFICDKLFKQACDKKDSYIAIDETREAIRDSIESLDTINVNHFWIDGIWEDKTERLDQIQTQRRKFLIAYAEIKRCKGRVKKQDILASKLLNDVAIDSLTEGFINRGILLE